MRISDLQYLTDFSHTGIHFYCSQTKLSNLLPLSSPSLKKVKQKNSFYYLGNIEVINSTIQKYAPKDYFFGFGAMLSKGMHTVSKYYVELFQKCVSTF